MWSGSIAISLITLPVQLYAATEERRVHFREVHAADGARVRYKRVCSAEDREIEYADTGRAWETLDGQLVQISDAELDQLPLPTRRTCTVLGFAPSDVLDPLQLGRPYYAGPHGQAAARPYALMTEALVRTGRIGIGRLAIRSRERLVAIVPRDGVLVVHTLRWPDEIRDPAELAPTVALSDRELDLAQMLISQLTDVDLAAEHDDYTAALEALVDAKLDGREIEAPREPAPVADLMATLEAAVRQAREGRGE